MREIKFRGKKEGSRVWDYGDLAKDKDGRSFIVDIAKDNIGYVTYLREIDPKTVCQYTGLKDKNGVEIYEGDIVKVNYIDCIYVTCTVEFGEQDCDDDTIMGWYLVLHEKQEELGIGCIPLRFSECIEVIGNIYDNPELLKEME